MKTKLNGALIFLIKKSLIITMKAFIFLFSVLSFGINAEKALSQNTIITFESDMEISMEDVFKIVKKQTDHAFVYETSLFKDTPKIKINKGEIKLGDLLEKCKTVTPFNFQFSKSGAILFKKMPPEVIQQEITGKVTDKLGLPLPGVTVLIKGFKQGTATDFEGNYSINAPTNSVLVFSFIGYQNQEITVTEGKRVLNVIMQEEISVLKEVLISTGYQKLKPEQSTGSTVTISAKDIDTRVNTSDFFESIQNKVPGLLINNDVEFEGNSLFQIRGVSTIYGNKQPLIVVDGYPTELSFDMINPNEIESITILKDAAAATVYGARSSNGVIIIERKKAEAGKPKVNFRTTFSFTPKEDYSRYRWDENASEIITEWEKINPKSLVTDQAWDYLSTQSGGSYNLNPAVTIIAHWKSLTDPITIEERDRQLSELASYNNTDDYSKLFLRPAITKNYNLNVSGGNDNAKYYITTDYSQRELDLKENEQSLFRLSARTTIDFSERFSFDMTSDLNISDQVNVPIPDINSIYPYERFQDNDNNPLSIHSKSLANPYYNEFLMNTGLLDNRYYPLSEMKQVSDDIRNISNRITANFQYKLTEELNFSFGGVYESSRLDNRHLAEEESLEARQYINRYTTGTSGSLVFNIPKGGFLREQNSTSEGYTLRAQANYNKQFKEDHTINIILGGEVREIINKSNSSAYFGYDDNTLFTLPVDYSAISGMNAVYSPFNPTISFLNLFSQGYENNRFVSAYSNIVYSFKNKYSLTGSIRVDQSNLFGTNPKYKYKPLWSAGAAWNIHKEDFMKDIELVNSMKLRAAYGFNGNVAKNALPQVIASNGLNTVTPNEVTPMLDLYSYANSGLRWEQTRNFNLGLDTELLDKINVHLDYYVKKSTDILATNQIDATKGGNSALINRASILNKGFEIDIDADWISKNRFNWNTGLVFSYNKSEVIDVYNPNLLENTSSRNYIAGSYADYLKGYSIGAMFNLKYAGVDNEGYPMSYDENGVAKRFFTDDQGLADLEYAGSSIPVYNAGFSNRVDIGDFYIYCMAHFYGGFKVRVPAPTIYNKIRPIEGADNYWRQPGDEADADILPFPSNNDAHYIAYTDKYTVNGAYLTIGDLTASYSFRNSDFIKNSGIANLEIKLQASNIYTVGFNKENFSKGTGSYQKTYMTPTYTLGLNFNF
ncbi:SusC/RagA family TonB-linked outer membrane protein [Lutibacter sp. A80]|uniref:SusC/RagA family TonB-linked outer membrane protein n=1 Tax=Lutibacter sp. A80 TaxID=2918453 RepID=UPI001F054B9D|nr:SusC/RagA family TonB-linked outer membrane protein [Lutibacter sp. A80]UMB59566.1 SusC/RagA family TonB-linked outer membrane protein [Lutibacter sp. A80]